MARGSASLHSLCPENSWANSSVSASAGSRSSRAMAAGLATTRRGSSSGSGCTGLEKASPRRAKRLSKTRSARAFNGGLQRKSPSIVLGLVVGRPAPLFLVLRRRRVGLAVLAGALRFVPDQPILAAFQVLHVHF